MVELMEDDGSHFSQNVSLLSLFIMGEILDQGLVYIAPLKTTSWKTENQGVEARKSFGSPTPSSFVCCSITLPTIVNHHVSPPFGRNIMFCFFHL